MAAKATMSSGPMSNGAMLTVEQALAAMAAGARPLEGCEMVATEAACGRVLAQPLIAGVDVPPADNSQMDGYAVRAADCAGGAARLPVSQRIAAGTEPAALLPGTAARIFTGAFIPPGADAVVMQEHCTLDGDHVTVGHTPQAGEWIRRRGEDIAAGKPMLAAGVRLQAAQMGLAASVGLALLPVRPRLKVAIFFTGDELTMPGQAAGGKLAPGAIYNSNRYLLHGLLHKLDCQITDYGIVADSLAATRATLRAAASTHDLIITSGGVSVGEEDHVKPAVEAEGHLHLWQIAVKPGKPLAFGEVRRGEPGSDKGHAGESAFFIGLPGNPVASFITFLLFVRPFILRMQGAAAPGYRSYPMRADFSWPRADVRNEFLRAKINAQGGLDLFANQGSAVLTSLVWGDGLIDNPPGHCIAPGDIVRFIPFSEFS